MSDGVTRPATDLVAVIRARIHQLGLSHSEVDHLAGLAQGHTNKILNGKKKPRTDTLANLFGALALVFEPHVDAEREAMMRPLWVKRRRE
jgi:predicted transcriptional regulator